MILQGKSPQGENPKGDNREGNRPSTRGRHRMRPNSPRAPSCQSEATCPRRDWS